ncbi:FtsQ-type POTRA domain-containing protein [Candidatus Pelagibacter sp.]|nr:FtsQ-type POTRA domain-containing protein [Candidatus Pelagibacter sp.]
MHQRKSKKSLVYIFFLLIFSSINNNTINNLNFIKTQNINIHGLNEQDNKSLLNEFKNLNLENIFSINKNEIVKLINSNSLIEKYEVFKKYPSTIDIKIEKTNFLAKINKNGKIYLIGSNGKLTLNKSGYVELPYIFGNPNINEFLKLKKIIDKSEFSYDQIKKLYFFPLNRWDLKLKEDILLKLPSNYTYETLDHLKEFLESYDDKKSVNIIDARIKNQIILNE